MKKRLQNIIREYPKLYLDEIDFNDNRFELEIDLFNSSYKNRNDFVNDCNEIKKELEKLGFRCAYDSELNENIYRLYIII